MLGGKPVFDISKFSPEEGIKKADKRLREQQQRLFQGFGIEDTMQASAPEGLKDSRAKSNLRGTIFEKLGKGGRKK